MSHFAQIDKSNIVVQVIVAEQEFIDSGVVGDPKHWIQTSYNTREGVHPENRPLRKNFAGVGYMYDPIRDAFIPPKPFNSWVLDEDKCRWVPPITHPNDGVYFWDEETLSWTPMNDER
jgi:hypothetical protein